MRKIVQIAFNVYGDINDTSSRLCALADDGTIWYYWDAKWTLWIDTPLPQDETEQQNDE